MKKYQHLFKLAVLNTFIVPNTFSMEGDNIQDVSLIEEDNMQNEFLIVRDNIQDASTQTENNNEKMTSENISELVRVLLLILLRLCGVLLFVFRS